MKYEEFKIKINELNANLNDVLMQKQTQLIAFHDQTIKTLFENKDSAHVALSELEVHYQRVEEEKNQHISSLKSILTNLREEQTKEVTLYKNQHNANNDKERLLNAKEDSLAEFKLQKKKETHELNLKINALDKECIQILKNNQMEFEEEERNYKSKIAELEKKMKFEVQKINEAILTPSIRSNKTTETSYENRQDYQVDKEVKAIRQKGIIDISKIKLNYLFELKELELSFSTYGSNFKRDNDILREEYNLQIEELKYLKKKVQDELQFAIDMYDFDTYKTFHETEKEYATEVNHIIEKYNEKIYRYQDEIIQTEKQKNEVNHHNANVMYSKVLESDLQQALIFNTLASESVSEVYGSLNDLNEFLTNVGIAYRDMMIYLFEGFWTRFHAKERQFYESLIFLSYHSYCFNGFNYKDFNQEVLKLSEEFLKNQILRFENFKQQLNDNFKKLLKQVKNMYQGFVAFKNQEDTHIKEYLKLLEKTMTNAQEDGKIFNQKTYDEWMLQTTHKADAFKQNKQNEIHAQAENHRNVHNDFNLKSKDLEGKLKQYQQKRKENLDKELSLYRDTVKAIKQNILKIKQQHKLELKAQHKEILKNHMNQALQVENEKKTKLKIGLI